MSERVEVEAGVSEIENAPEVPAAAMGAAACVSCVGCPLMQQCALPQAVQARAREAAGEANELTEPMTEVPAELDYAAALLDENGAAVVWAQAAVPAAPEPALSEEVLPAPSTTKYEEEAAEPRELPPQLWTISMNTLWEMPAAEPELESVFDPRSATEPGLALDPDPVPEATPDPVPPLDSNPASELVVEREPETEGEAEPRDGIGITPVVVHQEVRAAADPVETPAAPVTQSDIESSVQMSIEPAVEVSVEPVPEANVAPNAQAIEHCPVVAETVGRVIPREESVVPWVAAAHEEPAMPQPEQVDEVTLTLLRDDVAVSVSEGADYAVEWVPPAIQEVVYETPDILETDGDPVQVAVVAPDVETVSIPDAVVVPGREDLTVESDRRILPLSLAEAPKQTEYMLVGVDDNGMPSEEIGVSAPEVALSAAGDEEVVCDEVLLSPVGVEMEEADNRANSEPYQEPLTNVVYNTTNRNINTVLGGRDSDHAESEAPNVGYGTSWLAALLGVVAVFTVVRRRSGAV